MSNTLPSPDDCCATCEDVTVPQVPGPRGNPGANGTNGTDGVDAFTLTTAVFTMPAVSANVNVEVADSTWIGIGQFIFIETAGHFQVAGVPDPTHVILTNLGYTGNHAPGLPVIPSSSKVSPSGIKGTDGSVPAIVLNSISPTTTKGDLIVDDGANTPLASDVRLSAGANGTMLCADSTLGVGIGWKPIVPTATTDNQVPRFNGTTGSPVPLQTSFLIITDNGALQCSGSGGNARGVNATDLQVVRIAATQVASGINSGLLSGENNTASATDACVVGGSTNTASIVRSFIGGGLNNTASTSGNTAIVGGNGNTASGLNAFVGGGDTNIASGTDAVCAGGSTNTASAPHSRAGGLQSLADKHGQVAQASGQFANQGDAQKTELIWRAATSDATPTEMFLDGAGLRAVVTANKSWGFQIIAIGRAATGASEACWKAEGMIHNNAGTTALTAAITSTVIADGTGGVWGLAANFAVTASDPNDALVLTVTGNAATNIRWVAHATIVETLF